MHQHYIRNKMTCAHSEDSSAQSGQSLACALKGKLWTHSFFMWTRKTDQTAQMSRLIWSVGRAHRSFCWFCRAAAHLILSNNCYLKHNVMALELCEVMNSCVTHFKTMRGLYEKNKYEPCNKNFRGVQPGRARTSPLSFRSQLVFKFWVYM